MRSHASGWTILGRVAIIGLSIVGAYLASVDAFTFVFFASYMAVGAILVTLRPRSVVGWLLIMVAYGFIVTTTPPDFDLPAVLRGDASARDKVILWIEGWAGLTTYLGFVALTIVFPNGRIPDRGRRTSVFLLLASVVLIVLAAIAPTVSVSVDATRTVDVPNPFPVLPGLPIWSMLPIEAAIWPAVRRSTSALHNVTLVQSTRPL